MDHAAIRHAVCASMFLAAVKRFECLTGRPITGPRKNHIINRAFVAEWGVPAFGARNGRRRGDGGSQRAMMSPNTHENVRATANISKSKATNSNSSKRQQRHQHRHQNNNTNETHINASTSTKYQQQHQLHGHQLHPYQPNTNTAPHPHKPQRQHRHQHQSTRHGTKPKPFHENQKASPSKHKYNPPSPLTSQSRGHIVANRTTPPLSMTPTANHYRRQTSTAGSPNVSFPRPFPEPLPRYPHHTHRASPALLPSQQPIHRGAGAVVELRPGGL